MSTWFRIVVRLGMQSVLYAYLLTLALMNRRRAPAAARDLTLAAGCLFCSSLLANSLVALAPDLMQVRVLQGQSAWELQKLVSFLIWMTVSALQAAGWAIAARAVFREADRRAQREAVEELRS